MERRRRMRYLAWVVLLLGIALSAQGLAANEAASGNAVAEESYPVTRSSASRATG